MRASTSAPAAGIRAAAAIAGDAVGAAGTTPDSVAVGDFDGNGKQDLAVANEGSANVTILLGDGTGNFTAAATSPEGVGSGPRSVASSWKFGPPR